VKVIELDCQFCGEIRCKDAMTSTGVRDAVAAYMDHLIESHWVALELSRQRRMAVNVPINDWTQL
jgi:hypothetical protein